MSCPAILHKFAKKFIQSITWENCITFLFDCLFVLLRVVQYYFSQQSIRKKHKLRIHEGDQKWKNTKSKTSTSVEEIEWFKKAVFLSPVYVLYLWAKFLIYNEFCPSVCTQMTPVTHCDFTIRDRCWHTVLFLHYIRIQR